MTSGIWGLICVWKISDTTKCRREMKIFPSGKGRKRRPRSVDQEVLAVDLRELSK